MIYLIFLQGSDQNIVYKFNQKNCHARNTLKINDIFLISLTEFARFLEKNSHLNHIKHFNKKLAVFLL